MSFLNYYKKSLFRAGIFSAAAACFVIQPSVSAVSAMSVVEKKSNLAVIRGFVHDEAGKPISNAIVAVFRYGTSKVLKQVRSGADGGFFTKINPGKYTVLAIAQGYNATTLSEVQLNQSGDYNYGFKLERAGSGNTLPEKKSDRKSSKWIIRAAQNQRSIYQANEGEIIANKDSAQRNDAETIVYQDIDEDLKFVEDESIKRKRKGQSIIETYTAASDAGLYTGLNFATVQPLGEKTEIVFLGQTGTKTFAPQRVETIVKISPTEKHQIRLGGSLAKLGKVRFENEPAEGELGQISFQALDEWQIRDGVILVLGFDYARFIGAGNDSAISPRFGAQFDINAKTRLKTSLTTQTEEYSWADAIDLEGSSAAFRNQFRPHTIAIKEDKPVIAKSQRLEFGIERVIDNASSIAASVFFDSVSDRGIGISNLPFANLGDADDEFLTVTQSGKAQGVSIVYSRRINKIFTASAGYSFGNGQSLSDKKITSPADIFENSYFRSAVAQLTADLDTGTSIKTIFRLSPQATVFAIDPFKGKLAIYDPGLSVVITQALPTWGLPVRAEAVLDARNIFDMQTAVNSEEGSLRLNLQQRVLRGGISFRF